MKTDNQGYYYFTVVFRRAADEDMVYINEIASAQKLTEEQAARYQFVKELQEAYDNGMAGFFEVLDGPTDISPVHSFPLSIKRDTIRYDI